VIYIIGGLILGGIVGFSLAYLTGMFLSIKTFRTVEIYCLWMLVMCLEDLVFIREIKYQAAAEADNIPENELKIMKNEDEVLLDKWKHDAIKKLIMSAPPFYQKVIVYRTWNQAMAWLNENIQLALDNAKKS